jgi:hypothetical protein
MDFFSFIKILSLFNFFSTDSEIERASFLLRVVPELRSYFAAFGYELYYHDCHLSTDGYSNTHDLEEMCLNSIENILNIAANNPENGILFMVTKSKILD